MAKNQKDEQPLKEAEEESEFHAEAYREIQDQEAATGGQIVDEEQVEAKAVEEGAQADAVPSAEQAAIHTDNQTAQEASAATLAPDVVQKSKKKVVIKPRWRSKKYQAVVKKLDLRKFYPLEEAIQAVKTSSYTKFDGTVEIHVKLHQKKGGTTELIRGLLQLPHSIGKQVKAAVLDEDLINKIAQDKKTDFDILIAAPNLMPKVAKIAKILGPQGKMPNPKSGTVTENPNEALAAITAGRIEYRADKANIVHLALGKVSWEDSKLLENAQALLGALPKNQISSITLSATMGPGIKVDIKSL